MNDNIKKLREDRAVLVTQLREVVNKEIQLRSEGKELPDDEQYLITMRHVDDLSYKEMAEHCVCSTCEDE